MSGENKEFIQRLIRSDKGLLVSAAVFADQLTKYLFYDHHWLSEYLLFTPLFNPGITGGYLVHKSIILIISVLGILMFYKLYQMRHISKLVYVLLMAGTIGNLLDRIILGGVRDFIDLQFFPIFNMADIYLTLAVLLLIYGQYRMSQNKASK